MNNKKSKKKSKPTSKQLVDVKPEEIKVTTENVEKAVNLGEKEYVPEIVSEFVVAEVKLDLETPKKPKRNRGKKKKQDKEDKIWENNENVEANQGVSSVTKVETYNENSLSLGIKEVENPALESADNKLIEVDKVTPVERKKKNKNKGPKPLIDNLLIKQVPTTVTQEEQMAPAIEEIELSKVQEMENENKSNNKKKTSHDSERSDTPEFFSCTSTFQKRIDVGDEPSTLEETLQTESIRDHELKENRNFSEKEKNINKDELLQKTVQEIKKPNDEESIKHDFHELKPTKKEEGCKNTKTKNKKDKKQLKDYNLEEPEDQCTSFGTKLHLRNILFPESVVEEKEKDLGMTAVKLASQDMPLKYINVTPEEISTKDNPKVKAKIAKPIEKKRIEKLDSQTVRKSEESLETCKKEEPDLSQDIEASNTEDILQDIHKYSTAFVLTQQSEVLIIPDNAMGKKRKKSPKLPKPYISENISPEHKIDLATSIENKETANLAKTDASTLDSEIITSIVKEIKTAEILKGESVNESIDATYKIKNVPEPKSRKKGKKTPKIPLTPGVIDIPPLFEIDSKDVEKEVTIIVDLTASLNKPTTHQGNTDIVLNKSTTDLSTDTPDTLNLEKDVVQEKNIDTNVAGISKYDECKTVEPFNIIDIPFIDTDESYKIDSDTKTNIVDYPGITEEVIVTKTDYKPELINLTSKDPESPLTEAHNPNIDLIPDVCYPRSSSQDLDTNNNTMIREVRPNELQLPTFKDTPAIQGSGETPTDTPKMFISDIVITEVDVKEKEDLPIKEKTDLKSKMLEVNKDMEELRRSIERSLAEFTAIEKSEENIEKQFEDRNKLISHQDKEKDLSQKIEVKSDKSVNLVESLTVSEQLIQSQTVIAASAKELEKDIMQPINPDQDTIVQEKDILQFLDTEGRLQQNAVKDQNSDSTFSEIPDKNKQAKAALDEKEIKEESLIDIQSVVEDKKLDTQCYESNIPVCPARKERKGKNKRKKGKQEVTQPTQSTQISSEIKSTTKDTKTNDKSEKSQSKNNQEKGKQQAVLEEESTSNHDIAYNEASDGSNVDYEPIENFEDALTSSTEDADINKSFEIIVNETKADTELAQKKLAANKPEIKIIGPNEEPKENLMPPKNLLGHPDIPVSSNKIDYKKEKNKTPNTMHAKVKIKDCVEIETPTKLNKTNEDNTKQSESINKLTEVHLNSVDLESEDQLKIIDTTVQISVENQIEVRTTDGDKQEQLKPVNLEKKKQSKQSQTDNMKSRKNTKSKDTFTQLNENEEFVYKYSFRKVFLQSTCNVCKKELIQRIPCNFCNLLFYCSNKHKDEDWPHHQALCFAISTIGHLKDQKYIYADTKNITGQNYRLIRMQMILSCEKVLKRRLIPWEQEVLLYPRICAEVSCRQWKQGKLKDCGGCGQISYCSDHPDHLPNTHQRWCKSYALYQKLVIHQQIMGRLEPKLPTKVMVHPYQVPDKINEVLASMYAEKIDMNDIQYAALTQLATAPLTAAYGHQVYRNKFNLVSNGISKKSVFAIHVVGAELQFEADALNKWEVFFLHLRPDIQELKVVLISSDLNPSNLPLDLLGKIKLCENCRNSKRRVTFGFQDKTTYPVYRTSPDYFYPDLVCAFNPSIQRSSAYKDLDTWPSTLNTIFRTKVPFIITAYTMTELLRDSLRIKDCVEIDYKTISEAKYNNFASVRPDRNFITDDEMPLLFKNYCFMIISGC